MRDSMRGLAVIVTGLAVLFVVVSTVAAVATLAQIPDTNALKLTPTPAANAPAFAAEVETAVSKADPAEGQALFNQYGCVTCHGIANGTGPYVGGLGQRAATRRPNYSAAAYIYESIIAPNAYVVESYPPSVMPQNFKAIIPTDKLYALIAWLLTQ